MPVTTPIPPSLYRTADELFSEWVTYLSKLESPITDFSSGSVARTLAQAFCLTESQQTLVANILQSNMYVATASGAALDLKAGDWFVTRKPAIRATGVIELLRPGGGEAIAIPAGWAQLITQAVPGQSPVSFLTLEEVTLALGATKAEVTAQALLGGVEGNIAANTVLIPQSPILGIQSVGGFKAKANFTGGVAEETDEAFRERIRLTVQGRINGNASAYAAAALSIAGVTSVKVLKAGETISGGGEVPAGHVRVYYAGSEALLESVQSAVNNVSVTNAGVEAFHAANCELKANLTINCLSGTNTEALANSVKAALVAFVDSVAVGRKVYYAEAVETVMGVSGVVSVNLPFASFYAPSLSGVKAADVITPNNQVPNLKESEITVTVEIVPE
jgi:uncharacterized phage protein gp47/JayE